MADTPDDLLAKARAGMGEWLDAEDRSDAEFEAAQRMYQGIYDLDRALSSGAPLPSAWADCAPARPAQDVPLPGVPDIAADVREAQRRIEAGEIADTWAPVFDISEPQPTADQIREQAAARIAEALHRAGEMEHRYDMLTLTLRDKMTEIAGKDAEIARLTAELDDCRNTPVEYVPTAGIEMAMAADPDREDGTLLREMGGQKRAWAWKAAAREWELMP